MAFSKMSNRYQAVDKHPVNQECFEPQVPPKLSGFAYPAALAIGATASSTYSSPSCTGVKLRHDWLSTFACGGCCDELAGADLGEALTVCNEGHRMLLIEHDWGPVKWKQSAIHLSKTDVSLTHTLS